MTSDQKAAIKSAVRDFVPISELAADRIQKAQDQLSTCMDLDKLRQLQGQIEEAKYWQKLGALAGS